MRPIRAVLAGNVINKAQLMCLHAQSFVRIRIKTSDCAT